MTWTYFSSQVQTSDLYYIRLRIGDNSSGDPLMQDEEIQAVIADVGDRLFAASRCARTIAGLFSRRVRKSAGRLSLDSQQAAQAYLKLAGELAAEAALKAQPYAGGISISDKESQLDNSDRVAPQFFIGQTDLPGEGIVQSSTDLLGTV